MIGTRNRVRLLAAASGLAGAMGLAGAAEARCVTTGTTVVCDANAPNPEPNGAAGTTISVLPNAQIIVADPFAGASPRRETVILNAGGLMTTGTGSLIRDPAAGGAAVAIGADAVLQHGGTIRATIGNSRGVTLGARSSLTVGTGAIIETTAAGSTFVLQNNSAAIGAAGAGSSVIVNGTVRTSGANAPAIRSSSLDSISGTQRFFAQSIVVNAGGEVTTTGANAPAIATAGGSSVTVGGTVRATGAGSAAITYGAGTEPLTITLLQGGTIAASSTQAITGDGANVDLTIAGTLTGPGANAVVVALGNGADRVTQTGTAAISGVIAGGAGADTVRLLGASATPVAGQTVATYTGFERLAVDSGHWTTPATLTGYDDVAVASGATLTSAQATTLGSTGAAFAVTNAGTIASTNAAGRAINISGTANARTIAIVNAAGGLITSADDAIRVNINPTGGSIRIDNAGMIRTTNGGQALDFDAAASGAASIVINNLAGGELRSFGQDAIRPGQGAVVTNAGLIFADGAPSNNYDGIDWQNKSGVVVNQTGGTISGLRHGITSDVAVDVTNQLGATIVGRNGSGIGSDGTGTVVNFGTITGTWDGVATNGDGDGVDIDFVGTVRNFGTIQGLSANGVDSGGRPNSGQGVAMGGGVVENAAGATILGQAQGILINHDTNPGGLADAATTVTNSGTIRGIAGPAITFAGGFADTITNSGIIAGGAGVALEMGGGNDTLALLPGSSIVGTVDGGTGTDRVLLGGTGAGSFAGATNFERLDVTSGSWTLTGASTFANGTGIATGATLTGTTTTLTGNIANAGTLRIDQASDGLFVATLTGRGSLVKAGSGSVTIGNQAGFNGATSVTGGRLVLAGTLPSAVTVGSGATLAGTGSVASATFGNGAVLSPGLGGIGTLTVTGPLVQQSGSIYAVDIAAGTSDRVVVGGTATIQSGARLAVSGTGSVGTRYVVLTAAGGVTGNYALTQPTGGDTELRLGGTATSIFADIARTGAATAALAQTRNQRAVGAAFAGLGVGNAAYAALTLIPDVDVVRTGLDALSGEVHASLATTMVKDAQIVEGAVLSRALGPVADPDTGIALWGTALGNSGEDDGTAGIARVDRNTLGGVGGLDIATGSSRVGIAGGYTRTQVAVDGRASEARARTVHVIGYSGGMLGPIALRAGVGYARARNRTERDVAFPGFADRLRGRYDGDTLHSVAEAGVPIALGGGSVQPFAGFQAYRVHLDGFVETGGPAALRVAARKQTYAFTDVGFRFAAPLVDGLSARGTASWQRRVDGDTPTASARFATGGSAFAVTGAPLSRDAVRAGVDIVWAPAANISVTSGYAGLIGDRGSDSTFRLSASIGF